MAVLLAESVDKSFADRTVLRGATLSVDAGEHVGLIGTNGSGKSTLLSILSGALEPDRGRLVRTGRIALLTQDPQFPGCATVEDVVRDALAWHRDLLRDWNVATEAGDLRAQERIQGELDTRGWEVDHKIDAVLGRIGAPARSAGLDRLSGGERRRLALAAALLQDADVLLLDEPTNHLDAEAVEWLESWLTGFRGAVLLVTHDRYLLESVAERIVEVERGELVSYDGSYGDYVVAHAEREARLAQHRDRLLRTITTEAAWAARSPSARTVKQKARLQRLDALRDQVPELRDTSLSFAFATGVPRGVTLVEMHGLEKAYGGRALFSGVDEVLRPGDRLAVLGPNGAGKSTLLRTLTGEVTPDRGTIAKGPRAKIGVLDQARTGLDPDATVFEAAGDDQDHIVVGGNSIHVATFLGRFAFARESFGQRVSALSGGERARLLLAKLMLQGANVLLLDEPTNDLDLLTLRTLEDALLGFDGALMVISHDRAFVDRVSTRVIAFEGDGKVVGYASRQQWMAARAAAPAAAPKVAAPKPAAAPAPKRDKLSFKEQKELADLPAQIERAEADKRELEAVLADPATYKSRAAEVAALSTRLEALSAQVDALYARWEELEKRS